MRRPVWSVLGLMLAWGCSSSSVGQPAPTQEAEVAATDRDPSCADDPAFEPLPEGTNLDSFIEGIWIDDQFYEHSGLNDGVLATSQLGVSVAEVCVNLVEAGVQFTGVPVPDGTAFSLSVGTPIRIIEGSDPASRVGVEHGGQVQVYERFVADEGTPGDEAIHVADGIESVTINSRSDGTSPLMVIDDPVALAGLVDEILAAVVDSDLGVPLPNVILDIEYPDNTSTERGFSLDTGALQPGLRLSEWWLGVVTSELFGVDGLGDFVHDRPEASDEVLELFRTWLTTPDLDARFFQSASSAGLWAESGVADPEAGPVVKQPTIREAGVAYADVVLVGQTGIDLGIVTAFALETDDGWVISDVTVRETIGVAENWPA